MERIEFFITFMLAVTMSFISCKKQSVNDRIYNVKLNKCTSSAGENLIICFDSLITDSRCAVNGVCVWAGVAIAKFWNVISFTLATNTFSYFHNDTTINQLKISLQDILSYPSATQPSATPTVAVLK